MKKKIGRILKLKGRRSYVNNDDPTRGAKQYHTITSAYAIDDKPNILTSGRKPEGTIKSGESNINEEKLEMYNQNDPRQGDNVFLIENYAELLVQKLRPLNNSIRKFDHYSSDDQSNHAK